MDRKPNILVVDDYELNREVTKEMLEMLDCEVDIANCGKEALNFFEINRYDMIFMDIQMPEMDGIEVTKKIREKESQAQQKTKIVALTANALEGDKEKYIREGVDDYLSKPVKIQDIEGILNKYGLIE